MKKQGTWSVTPVILVMGAALLLLAVGSFFLNRVVFYFVAPAVLFILGYPMAAAPAQKGYEPLPVPHCWLSQSDGQGCVVEFSPAGGGQLTDRGDHVV